MRQRRWRGSKNVMEEIAVRYYGYVFDASGYGNAARSYIHAMHEAGIRLSVVDLANRSHQVHDELVESLQRNAIEPDFHLYHGIPPQWGRMAFKHPNGIGMTVWETDVMPTQWRNALNQMLEVWLPCEFNVAAFGKALERPVFRLPHPVGTHAANGFHGMPDNLKAIAPEDFVFYSIFEWQDRKCPLGLLVSFLKTFSAADRVVLVIKTNPGAAGVAQAALDASRRETHSDARVVLYAEGWSDPQIAALHNRGDCYVSLHRGEGWNYPLFDAVCLGKPAIATAYSGPMDYLNAADHLLVRYRDCSVQQPYLYYNSQMHWADPDLTHASELMRWAFSHQSLARERSLRTAPSVRALYAPRLIGQMAMARLKTILRRTDTAKWERLNSSRLQQFTPTVGPVSPEWYDSDYFESGVKSNWNQGYSWQLFSGLFQETARFLTSMFPEADSFLDIGCAKGFLVRCLRELGKNCMGFDFSPWAVNHAEASVREFIQCASVDTFEFEKQVDLMVSFEVFEHLTEVQIRSFLNRARRWARLGLFATIPSFQTVEEQEHYAQRDKDMSHVTMKSRQWWHETFLDCGWRQDPLHRNAQSICQKDELPAKMGWQVYLYVPDNTCNPAKDKRE